jgi:hypothetical protein
MSYYLELSHTVGGPVSLRNSDPATITLLFLAILEHLCSELLQLLLGLLVL